ncbi:uncharacterized protein [Argopecten irradians]|uniref:uncharacterized protein n=1 Tax=Argopecten irradians TaxID=31199 RepID=UPI003714F2E4
MSSHKKTNAGQNNKSKTGTERRQSTLSLSGSADEKLEHIYQTLATLMTKDDLVFQMNKLREEIREENREMVQRLECRVFELETENDKLRDTIEQLENSVELSVERIVQLTLKDNSLEQQGRKNSVRIVGLPNDRNETAEACIDKCAKFFRDYLNVDIESTDIDIAHRLGPQSTICKFTRRIKKFEVLKARRKLKGKKIYIFEDLTQENQRILKRAYDLGCVENTWSVDGKLFAKLKGKETIRRISMNTVLTDEYLLDDGNFVSRSGNEN